MGKLAVALQLLCSGDCSDEERRSAAPGEARARGHSIADDSLGLAVVGCLDGFDGCCCAACVFINRGRCGSTAEVLDLLSRLIRFIGVAALISVDRLPFIQSHLASCIRPSIQSITGYYSPHHRIGAQARRDGGWQAQGRRPQGRRPQRGP